MVWFWALVLLGFCCPSGILGEEFELGDSAADPNTTTTVGLDVVTELRFLVSHLARRVEELEKKHEGEVAFSAGFHNKAEHVYYGPFDTEATLVFKNVLTNTGNAYDRITGIFTAPRRGMYFMHLTACRGQSGSVNAALLMNGRNMFAVYDSAYPKENVHSCSSNGMTLQLDKEDALSVVLWRKQSLFDNSRLTTFSGFLLFPN